MKSDTHPTVFKDAKTTCITCGTIYKVPSTVKEQQVEVCSRCHPVYTGEYRGVIASGRVDRFRKMMEASKEKKEKAALKPAKKPRKKK
jgi:large subunit ribosomal protein L31